MWEVAHSEGSQWPSSAQLSDSTKFRILTAPLWFPRPQLWKAPSLSTISQGSFSPRLTCHLFRGAFQHHYQLPLEPLLCTPNTFCISLSAFSTVLTGHS